MIVALIIYLTLALPAMFVVMAAIIAGSRADNRVITNGASAPQTVRAAAGRARAMSG